ncbi:DUF6504 family protein [Chloroflexota bacterium]
MCWKIYDESVEMEKQRHQFFPKIFCWRGRRFDVQAVERSWTVSRRRWRRRIARRFFQVRCAGGTFELYQDLQTGAWHLRRARLLRARGPVVRQTVSAWR